MKVSVVLPVFNGAQTIARAMGSILAQSLEDLELIVVDDGSTDDTASVVASISDSRIRFEQIEHSGVVVAANHGTSLAKSPLIARMDADDFAYPQKLELQTKLMDERNFDVVGCQVRILNADLDAAPSMDRYQQWINEETAESEAITALRFVEFPLVNPTILARRSYFELQFKAGDYPEDYDLMLRAAEQGFRFGKVREVLFDWIDSPLGLTRSDPRYAEAAFMNCRRRHLLTGPLRGAHIVDLWGVGKKGKAWLRWLHAETNIKVRHAYDVAERKVGETIHGVKVDHTDSLRPADEVPLLIAVGAANSRQVILPQVVARGFRAGHDAWFVS